MGTYHSYAGDAKLEDSKDNWYRINGMNIGRFNLGVNQRQNLIPSSLRKAESEIDGMESAAEYLIWGNILSDAWFKATGKGTYFPSQYKYWTIAPQRGRDFNIKDRTINIGMYNIEVKGNYNLGEISKGIYVPSTDPNPTLIYIRSLQGNQGTDDYWCAGLTADTNLSKFRPMLTLKPVGGGG